MVAAEAEVVARSPRPASRCTQSRPLTPWEKSLPALSASELSIELVELGVPAVWGGFSNLYLRNSASFKLFLCLVWLGSNDCSGGWKASDAVSP